MAFYDSESEDSFDFGAAAEAVAVAPASEYQASYNSYGRAGLGSNDTGGFQGQGGGADSASSYSSSGSEAEGGGNADGNADGNDDDSDDDEPAAAPIKPRGKTFRPPRGVGDSSSSSSEDEAVVAAPAPAPVPAPVPAAPAAPAPAPMINPNPAPRGKELRLIMKQEEEDSDDEPLAKRKKGRSKNKKAGSKNKKKAPPKAKAKAAPKKKAAPKAKAPAKKASPPRKRKKPPSPAADDSDSDSDGECVATIVGGSDAEGVAVASAAVARTVDAGGGSHKRAKGADGAAKKKASAKKSPAKKGGGGGKKAPAAKKGSSSASASASARKRSSLPGAGGVPEVSAAKAAAAAAARASLRDSVPSLPHAIVPPKPGGGPDGPGYVVRSFGRIRPEYDATSPLDATYAGPHAIYPAGYSCDRYEFSPVHGRVVRMRCDILDGSSLRAARKGGDEDGKGGPTPDVVGSGGGKGAPKATPGGGMTDPEDLGDGPVFRVTWGEGVEEDPARPEQPCPFDPYVASAHLGEGDVDAIAVPLSSRTGKRAGLPEAGMRVSVRFGEGKTHGGVVEKVEEAPSKASPRGKGKGKTTCEVTIKYDDGVTEVAAFPDPDIVVAYQGCPPIETPDGYVSEMNGKPVCSILARTPLEAWGKTLLSLGLIDEIVYKAALRELQSAREDGLNDSKKKGKENKPKGKSCPDSDHAQTNGVSADKTDERQEQSPEEIRLRKMLSEMQNQIDTARERTRAASLNLANTRISAISPFAANPFTSAGNSSKVESTWLAATLKKERANIPGNKRKIVNPATILDRSDTFFLPAVERLVEGLPGTEFAPSYIFHADRSAPGNKAIIQEAKLRHQRQQKMKQQKAEKEEKAEKAQLLLEQKKSEKAQVQQTRKQKKKQQEREEKARKAEARAKIEQERELKRKLKEEEAEERKRLREEELEEKRRLKREEEEEKRRLREEEAEEKRRLREEEEERRKRERVEKRLAQLGIQMNDRLFKESCMMREKNIVNFVRIMNKEFARRRKAVEVVVGNKIDRSAATAASSSPSSAIAPTDVLAPFAERLPPLSRAYDVEVVRMWDFLHSFSGVFSKSQDESTSLPTLDSLQDAMNCLKMDSRNDKSRSDAIGLFEGIAIELCKVISPSLTKTLSSSNTTFDTIGRNGTDGGPQEDSDVSCLPVTIWTWREIARMIIVHDVLLDLGYSKQEASNLVKGFRSGGHPNSKEARRWKKIEESPVMMMYHRLENHDDIASDQLRSRAVRAVLSAPCAPSCVPSDWRFFLHNIKSRSLNSARFIKINVGKALEVLKKDSSEIKDAQKNIEELERCLAILERSGQANNNVPELHKAKQIAVDVLDSTIEKSPGFALEGRAAQQHSTKLMANQTSATQEPTRQRMGFRKIYELSKEQFKALDQSKEEYMAAALRLKEELERSSRDDADDDDDDEDQDEAEDEVKSEGNAGGDKAEHEQEDSDQEEAQNDEDARAKDSLTNGEHMESKPTSVPEDGLVKAEVNQENESSSDEPINKSEETDPADETVDKSKDTGGACERNSVKENDSHDNETSTILETDKAEEANIANGTVAAVESGTADEIGSAKKDPKAEAQPNDHEDSHAVENTTGHATLSEKDQDLPAEPAEGFPEGWLVRRLPRTNPNDKRLDRNWYSPKLGLRFRCKIDAQRFLEILESMNGDESAAIMEFHGKNKTPNKAADKSSSNDANNAKADDEKAGDAKADYEFCEDVPLAPELIRRCLAVLRTVCASNSADQFVYPVDPQLYPGYYEIVINPMSLYDIGKLLQEAGRKFASSHDDPQIEEVVAEVGRKVRAIVQNSIFVNSSNIIVNSAEEMLRLFERLFFDWVLAPSTDRPELQDLDDDRCIDHHESDLHSMVLLCDACEGKYNMSRLKPALVTVPSGDWYCPRCVSGRSWLTVDPRIGRRVQNGPFSGKVQSCKFLFAEDEEPSIVYYVKAANSGCVEYWALQDVDEFIVGDPVEPIRCLSALAESPGYGFGRDSGIVGGAIPLAMNPLISDKAAQAALASGVFKDTVSTCVSLTSPPDQFRAEDWMTIFMLLVSKCTLSDDLQELSSNLENTENSRLSARREALWRARAATKNVVPDLSDESTVSSEEEESHAVSKGNPPNIPSIVENKVEGVTKVEGDNKVEAEEPPAKKAKLASTDDVLKKSSGEEASAEGGPTNMEISFQGSTELPDETTSHSTTANTGDKLPKDALTVSEEDKLKAMILAKTKRERKREEALMGYYVGHRLKSTAASFEEDFLSTLVSTTLCNQGEGFNLSSVRCREPCHYCGFTDVALGAPLCRTPNEKEWREGYPLAVHKRSTYMVAEIKQKSIHDTHAVQENGIKPLSEQLQENPPKLVAVRVRVGGELVTSKAKCLDSAVKPMQQFLPRNPAAYQSELRFRQESNLSFVSGSLSAHEACAIAAHRSRKEVLAAERFAFHRASMTRESALACGKSIPIGTDPFGRSYWVFSAEPSSLFICQDVATLGVASPPKKQWHRFHQPEEIASVMACLGKDPLCEALKEVYPEAARVLKDRSWSTLLYRRNLLSKDNAIKESNSPQERTIEEQADYGAPFVEDEDVLVESDRGKFLWDAVIVDVSKDPETDKVNGYLVHYKNWSSRFDQWVSPDRVVEPNKVNMEVQEEVLQDFGSANDSSPPMLEKMFAFQFLNSKKRARPTPLSKAEIFETAFTSPSASPDEKTLGLLKGALLLIEVALPRGSVGLSQNGSWNPLAVALWRNLVKDAQGPESLMRCVLLLEDAISSDWLHSQATQMYNSIPKQFRALGEATLPSIALRISILDRCLKYQQKKKKVE